MPLDFYYGWYALLHSRVVGDAMRHIGSLIAGLGTANNYLTTSPKETCVQIFVVNFNRSIGEIKREILKVIGVFESIIPLVGKLEDLEDSSFKSLLEIMCTRLEQFDETIKSIVEVQLKDVRKLSEALLTTSDHTTDPATLSALMIDLNFAKIEVNLLQIFNKLRILEQLLYTLTLHHEKLVPLVNDTPQ